MGKWRAALVCCFLITVVSAVWGQRTLRSGIPGGVGYIDPVTGEFRSVIVNPDVDANTLAATAPLTGKFVFNFTITIQSTIPTTSALLCRATVSTADVGSLASHSESADVTATRSGATAKCTVTLPYSWLLSTVTQDRVSIEYGVNTAGSLTPGAVSSRFSEHGLGSIAVPASGATTIETVAITM